MQVRTVRTPPRDFYWSKSYLTKIINTLVRYGTSTVLNFLNQQQQNSMASGANKYEEDWTLFLLSLLFFFFFFFLTVRYHTGTVLSYRSVLYEYGSVVPKKSSFHVKIFYVCTYLCVLFLLYLRTKLKKYPKLWHNY